MGLVSGSLVASYKVLAVSPKLEIQIIQNLDIPKKEQNCCLVAGEVNAVMALILSCDSCLEPGVKI